MTAAVVGIAGAVGLTWWMRKNAGPGEKSACEKACASAAKMAGATGDIDKLCAGACTALPGVLSAGSKVTEVIGDGMTTLYHGITGQRDRDDKITLNPKACPAGTTFSIFTGVTDHRGLGDLSDRAQTTGNLGAVCKDSKGTIVGTVMPDGFHPYAPSSSSVPPPVVPQPDPTTTTTTTTRGPRGGVTVT